MGGKRGKRGKEGKERSFIFERFPIWETRAICTLSIVLLPFLLTSVLLSYCSFPLFFSYSFCILIGRFKFMHSPPGLVPPPKYRVGRSMKVMAVDIPSFTQSTHSPTVVFSIPGRGQALGSQRVLSHISQHSKGTMSQYSISSSTTHVGVVSRFLMTHPVP